MFTAHAPQPTQQQRRYLDRHPGSWAVATSGGALMVHELVGERVSRVVLDLGGRIAAAATRPATAGDRSARDAAREVRWLQDLFARSAFSAAS